MNPISLDMLIDNHRVISELFHGSKKMVISEMQLDDIERTLQGDLAEGEMQEIWKEARNLQGVLNAFNDRLKDIEKDLIWRGQ